MKYLKTFENYNEEKVTMENQPEQKSKEELEKEKKEEEAIEKIANGFISQNSIVTSK